VNERELFDRHPANPILTAEDWPYPINAAFNPAAAQLDGTTVLLARVEDQTGLSHLSVARSDNGIDGWTIDPEPLLAPDDGIESEQWGFEDARVVFLPELERWAITCTVYGPRGPAVYLATTEDFHSVERHGIVRKAEDKNAALLPQRVDGKWILFHRPTEEFGGPRPHGAIVLSRSDDLVDWSGPELVLSPRKGAWWDASRIGIGPPLLQTEHGWLLIYHGVKDTVSGSVYRLGLALMDLEEPTRVLHRLQTWIFGPLTTYEREGDVPNVVFPCGFVHDEAGGEIRLYYGAADTSICLASARLEDLLEAVLSGPAETVG
jgi:beta-1,2-mannobiose phosphorylase / 1,2-beta-oligomannan phosphorylase